MGTSAPLKEVLSPHISRSAPTDSSVLITGETLGTGKELVARAIHRRSRRSSHGFVAVNCAAIPRDLVASELFTAAEKGGLHGSQSQRRLGRFEMADRAETIFLDEVGMNSLPDTQAALLRVLARTGIQRRVGGGQPVRVDVRVIAATNRDLNVQPQRMGPSARISSIRLNVFPIEMPPLRERKDDILILVEYFVQRYASRAGRNIRSIDQKTLDLCCSPTIGLATSGSCRT